MVPVNYENELSYARVFLCVMKINNTKVKWKVAHTGTHAYTSVNINNATPEQQSIDQYYIIGRTAFKVPK